MNVLLAEANVPYEQLEEMERTDGDSSVYLAGYYKKTINLIGGSATAVGSSFDVYLVKFGP